MSNVRLWCEGLARRLKVALRSRVDERIDDDELDQMRSWGLTAQLAAIDPRCIGKLPADVARLVRDAQELHPKMAEGARRRAEASFGACRSDEAGAT